MKRLCLVAGAVMLLSACPDTKLPTPTPKVPEPKAAALVPHGFDTTTPVTWNSSEDAASPSRPS